MDSKIALLGVFVLLAYPVTTLEQAKPKTTPETPQETGDDMLRDESAKFFGYSQDFLNMAKSYQGNDDLEQDVAMSLHGIANAEGERLSDADALLLVYSNGTCETKMVRAISRGLVRLQLSSASKYTDLEIQSTSNDLTHTRMPGIAVLAARMNDDLRDAKAKLDNALSSLK